MLSKRTTPVIGKLTNSFISGNRAAGIMDVATSPRGPLELFKIQSPRGLKNYDLGGVGLGIVAALEKTSARDHHHRIGNEIHNSKVLGSRNLNRSNPIPVNSSKTGTNSGRRRGSFEEVEMDSLEDYTFVTCHGPGNKSFTRVYYDGDCQEHGRIPSERTDFDRKKNSVSKRPSMFTLSSPARIGDFPAIPDSDFLRSCNLCHKKLQGEDIYMYRGEKAFCSSECRDSQILMDEKKEKCRSEASRLLDVSSSSPYKNGHGRQILSPGIFAI